MKEKITAEQRVLAGGTLAMAGVAFFGHLVAPGGMAGYFGWREDRWYQREIGAFNAGLGIGMIRALRGRPEEAFLVSAGASALLLAATRAAAVASGDRSGKRNVATVVGDLVLGLGAIHQVRALARVRDEAG
ncbi:hypothetical protein J4573_02560 [Actinomadura barringtoniae]|uniref:Uncharacterized protein n=1 Tax=Actinomadura barringtoniae TaxID=1427535 RepID=A0A939P5X9_9ACTN|nr:hypothetical protein [Actinomadura barringtoniae]MBO2445961.1 hypothetical protein [Actinomadura barringtoniae]